VTNEYVVIHSQSKSMPNVHFAELIAAVLSKGKPFRFQAKGYSMSPFIQNGDIITLSPISEKIKLGKVIAIFDSKKHLYLHRVVKIDNDRFLVRGDNISLMDGWFLRNEMLGCVTTVERQSKNIRIGLGPERIFIAFLSANGWLIPLVTFIRKINSIKKGSSNRLKSL
jgi:signal peptidase I